MGRSFGKWPPLAKSMISYVCKIPLDMLSRIIHRKNERGANFGPTRAKHLSLATKLLLPSDCFIPWPVWCDFYFAPHRMFDPVPPHVLREEEEMILQFKATILKRYQEWLQQLPPRVRDRLDLDDGHIFRYLFDFDQYGPRFREEIARIDEEFGYSTKKGQKGNTK